MGKLVKTLIPLQHLWSCMLGRLLVARVYEDNQAAIAVAKSGFSIALRHLAKHQRLNLGFLHDCFFTTGALHDDRAHRFGEAKGRHPDEGVAEACV